MKHCIVLVSLFLLLGCTAPQQIQCTAKDGQITYLGPYDSEKGGEFVVYVDDNTTDYYRKAACRKV